MLEKQKELEKYSGATKKLRKLGNLKGKISQKVSVITEEHKFFSENTVCPTCSQDIEETFRINRIGDAQNKAKELRSGFIQLEEAIKEEEERGHQFSMVSKEVTNLTHEISQINTKISGYQDKSEVLNKIQTVTDRLAKRILNMKSLAELQDKLGTV